MHIRHKSVIFSYVVLIFLCLFFWACRNKNENFRIAKTGTFYYYPRHSNQAFQIIRTDSLQAEINRTTGDTSFWRIKWKNECAFDMSFVRSTRKMVDEEREFYRSHILNCKILTVAPNYYIFRADTDPNIGFQPIEDTMWLKKRS
jgi:hypothetical protein